MNCSLLRATIGAAVLASLMVCGAEAAVQPGDTANWIGAASGGDWSDANAWQRSSDSLIGDAETVIGHANGSNGANTSPTSGFNIVIDDGASVGYDPPLHDYGFSIKQGSNLIIRDGASWTQTTEATDEETAWTVMDASNLIIDGGSFIRTGATTFDPGDAGGGLLIFGSWRADDNFAQLPAPANINILISNGGKLENEGDLWFGSGEDAPDDGLNVSMEINDGSLKLTGGDFFGDDQYGNPVDTALTDLAFTYGRKADFTPKGEKYEINFTGPGSITVSKAGITVSRQDEFGVWNGRTPSDPINTLVTYEQLWEEGILKSHGMSGLDGTAFTGFFTTSGTSGADGYTLTAKIGPTITWEGGNGNWTDAKWNNGSTGGLDAQTAFGRTNGMEDGQHAVIGGGSQVFYDAALINSDFRLKSQNGPTSVTIKEGAKLTLHSEDTDDDGKWTEWDGDLVLDNGTLARTWGAGVTGSTLSGGALIFGSWRSRQGQEIDIDITNGGRLENDGQLWFGAGIDQAAGLEVTMSINDGSLDLTGGKNVEFILEENGIEADADMVIFYARDETTAELKGEKYAINFTGPGSITVDSAGINVVTQQEDLFSFNIEHTTYEDLWAKGILQANGLSGLDGATFGDYFSTTNAWGQDDYTLTSLIGATTLTGDYNGNGIVDAADYTIWRDNLGSTTNLDADGDNSGTVDANDYIVWKNNFGSTAAAGSLAAGSSAVPEPSSIALVLVMLVAGMASTRTRR